MKNRNWYSREKSNYFKFKNKLKFLSLLSFVFITNFSLAQNFPPCWGSNPTVGQICNWTDLRPNPNCLETFLQCSTAYGITEMPCPPFNGQWLIFNYETQLCQIRPHCFESNELIGTPCNWTEIKENTECSQTYLKCKDGYVAEVLCPPDTNFNPVTKECEPQ